MSKHSLADCRLYGFVDTGYLAGRDPAELTRQLIAGGVDIIQVRAKKWSQSKLVALGKAVVAAAKDTPVPVIINDDYKAALQAGADGVHLGQEDWSKMARETRHLELLGMEILGLSTHSLKQAMLGERDGANYIGVGPIHATGTKPGREPVGYELLRQVIGRIHIPYFAIGGITLTNLDQVLASGARRIAVVSAILKAPDVAKAAAEFKRRLP